MNKNQVGKWTVSIGAFALLLWGIITFRDVVAYILVAWVLSNLGAPIVEFLTGMRAKKFRFNRSIAALTTLTTFILIIYMIASLLVPPIVSQTKNLSEIKIEDISASLRQPLNALQNWLIERSFIDEHQNLEKEIQTLLINSFHPQTIFKYFQSLIGTVGDLIVALFSIFFIAFFFLKDQKLFADMIASVVPDRFEAQSRSVLKHTRKMLTRYFGGLLVQAIIFMLLLYIILLLLGFKDALLIAFIAGLLNIIPYVGPLIGILFGVFVTISAHVGMDFYTVIRPQIAILVIAILAVQQVDGLLVQPNVIGKSVKAHPLEIFLIVLVGGKMAGLPGLILAIPAYTVLRIIAKVFFGEWKAVRTLTKNLS